MSQSNPRRALLVAAAATLLLLSVSCHADQRSVRRQLEIAEALLETDPEAAQELLERSSRLYRPSSKALADWAWMTVQADYKCFRSLTSDSLARLATRYYGSRRRSYHAAMAWYSLGCAYTDMASDVRAVDAFLTAQTLFPDTTVRYYALCCQNLGHHYVNRGMFDEALSAYRRFTLSPSVSVRDTLVNSYHIAKVYINKGEAAKAAMRLDSLFAHPRASEGLKQKAHFEAAKLCCYLREDYPAAKAHAYACLKGKTFGAVYSVLGDACLGLGQTDSAAVCFHRALGSDEELFTQVNLCRKMAAICLTRHQPDSVGYYMDRYTVLADSAWRQWNGVELTALMNRHELELQARAEKVQRQRQTSTLAALLVLVVLLGAFFFLLADRYHKNRFIRLQQLLSKARLEILQQKEKMEHMQTASPEDDDQLLALRRQQCSYSRQAFLLTPWPKRVNELESTGHDMTLEQHNNFRNALSDCFSDVMVDLKNECPSLNIDEVYYCLYAYLGMSTSLIAQCERSNPAVLRKRKSRIKSKLSDTWNELFFNV